MEIPKTEKGAAASTTVAEVMTKLVIAVRPADGVGVATTRVIEERVGAVPVLDAEGLPLGVLTETDLLRAAVLGEDLRADELMTGAMNAVHQGATLAFATALMADCGEHRLIAVDDQGRAVGILSAIDVLRWLAKLTGYSLDPTS